LELQITFTQLFNLIAQKDANLNITLAKDSRTLASASKRDSSSMKTLAAVTVAFLPGTFISSLFAMPLLDWNAGRNDSVVNGKFWIYWAFTIPLTLLTMFIWLIWTHRQTLLHRAQDRKAREQLDDDIREDQGGKIGQEV
jgi:Mg2+ and Co2+ transporter CorA